MKFLPVNQVSYAYGTSRVIEIPIYSRSEFLNAQNSYFEFDYKYDGGTTNVAPSFDVGGAHSLFSRMELEFDNVRVDEIDEYNVLYAIKALSMMGSQHVESVEWASGDSAQSGNRQPANSEGVSRSLTGTAYAYTNSTKTLVITGGQLLTESRVGDIVILSVGAELESGVIASITNNTTLVFTDALGAAGNLADADIDGAWLIKGKDENTRDTSKSARSYFGGTATAFRVVLKPSMDLMTYAKWLPLPFLRDGIRLRLHLAQPSECLNGNVAPSVENSSANTFSYVITNPRYVAELIEPADSVMAQYREAYMTGGLNLPYRSYEHRRKSADSSTQSETTFNFDLNLQSMTHAFGVLRSALIAQGTTAVVKCNDSLSTFLQDDITDFVWRLDSDYFPHSQRVYCEDGVSAEAWVELQKAVGHHGSTLLDGRIGLKEWRNDGTRLLIDTSDTVSNDSKHFIMSGSFSKDPSGYLTGLDVRKSPLDLIMKFNSSSSTVYGTKIIDAFCGYDALVNVSSSGVRVSM